MGAMFRVSRSQAWLSSLFRPLYNLVMKQWLTRTLRSSASSGSFLLNVLSLILFTDIHYIISIPADTPYLSRFLSRVKSYRFNLAYR